MGTVVLASAAPFHPQHHHHETFISAAATEHHPAIIPFVAATPCIVDDDTHAAQGKLGGGIHVWQPAQPQATTYHHHCHPFPPHHETNPNPNPNPTLYNYLRKPVPMLESRVILGATAGAGVFTCQDCGNQAKKDCSHRRCRTCCKSRGFDCSTHVKSTWVPAARRRERLLAVAAAAGSSTSTSAPKKPRLVSSQPATATASHTSTSNTTPRSFDTTSSQQDAGIKENLPGHVRAPALFKCVRVTSIDDGEDEYAYHAMVKIGGRVFKGFLYDHGLDDGGGHSDDGKEGSIPNLSELHLGNRFAGASSSSPMLHSSDAFGGGLVGSANYDNQIN